MSDPRLSVEFLGIPGAGKSAVSSRVGLILGERGFPVDDLSYRLAHGRTRTRRFIRKSFHVAKELLSHPFVSLRAIRAIACVQHPSLRVLAKMVFNWLLVSALARRGRKPGIHLCDQGIFQGLWSIGFGGGTEAVGLAAEKLWGLVPGPDLVVVIEADLPAILHRLRLRQERKSRIDRIYEQHPEILEGCARLLEATATALDAIRGRDPSIGVVVLRCQDEGDLDSESRRLASIIEDLLEERVSGKAALAAHRS